MTCAFGLMLEIHDDDFDARFGGGVGRSDEPLRIARIEDQEVHALGDHVLDVGDLFGHVVLAVRLRNLATGLLGLVDGRGDLCGEIGSAEGVHGDADLAVGRLGGAERHGRQGDCQRESRNGFLHSKFPPVPYLMRRMSAPLL